MDSRIWYLPLSAAALVAGLAVLRYGPPEGVLPTAILLSIAWMITRSRRGLDQLGLYRLYAVSAAVAMLVIAGLAITRAGYRAPGYALIAAMSLSFVPIICCARRDLDSIGRRKFYATSIVAALLVIVGVLLFSSSIW